MDIFAVEMLEAKIELLKAENEFDNGMAIVNERTDSICEMIEYGYFSESSNEYEEMCEAVGEKIVTTIKNFFEKLCDTIRELAAKLREKIQLYLVKKEIRSKLKEVSKTLAQNRTLANQLNGMKCNYFDTKRYYANYKKYTKFLTDDYRKLINTDYDNVDEYLNAVEKFNDEIERKMVECDLSNDEAYTLSAAFGTIMHNTEEDVKFNEKMIDMIWKESEDAFNEYRDICLAEDEATKIANTKSVSSKLASAASKALNKVAHFTLQNLGNILGIVGGVAGFKSAEGNDLEAVVNLTAAGAAAGEIVGTPIGHFANKGLDKHDAKKADKEAKKKQEEADRKQKKLDAAYNDLLKKEVKLRKAAYQSGTIDQLRDRAENEDEL